MIKKEPVMQDRARIDDLSKGMSAIQVADVEEDLVHSIEQVITPLD